MRWPVARAGARARSNARAQSQHLTVIALPYRPPFAWEHFLRFLRARSIAGVEVCDATSYTRTLRVDDTAGWLRVENDAARSQLLLTLSRTIHDKLPRVSQHVSRMFDVDADPGEIAARLRSDARLTQLVDNEPGLRLPGTVD